MQPSEEIKAKLDIVDLLREYIQLKPAGMNFRAVCPFHREKSPSLMVSPDKQIWHCFGCGKGGDVFAFVMEMEGLDFVDALRLLALKAGVTLRRQDPQLTSQRNRLMDILSLSARYYHKVLLDSRQAEAARNYLDSRGLTEETIEEWQLGYSPDSWDDLINFLKQKGYKENEIFSAGMSVKSEKSSRFYNRFRNRIMFPIFDINGNVVAFTARVSPEKEKDEKLGKYINSPQTQIYDKSRILFGLDKAKQAIKNEELAIMVEGQMDVITAHQNGFKNIIASSGTALTTEQVVLVKRFTENIALAFDMDKAGEMAIERGTEAALAAEMNIKVIRLDEGKDPDEYIRKNPDDWQRAVAGARPMMEYYFDKARSEFNLNKIDDRRRMEKIMFGKINKLKNTSEQDFWLNNLSQVTGTNAFIIKEEFKKFVAPKTNEYREQAQPSKVSPEKKVKTREEAISQLFISLLIKFPQFFEYSVNQIQPDQLDGVENQAIYRNLVIYYNNLNENRTQNSGGQSISPQIKYQNFRSWLQSIMAENGQNSQNYNSGSGNKTIRLLDEIVLLADKDFYDLENEQAKSEIIKIIIFLKRNYLNIRMKEIGKLIAEAERGGEGDVAQDLMGEFKALTDEMREIT